MSFSQISCAVAVAFCFLCNANKTWASEKATPFFSLKLPSSGMQKMDTTLAQEVRKAEVNKSWDTCADKALKLVQQHSLIKSWALVVALRCAKRADEDSQKLDRLSKVLEMADRNPEMFSFGTAKESLWQERISAELAAGDLIWKSKAKDRRALALAHWNKLLSFGSLVDRDIRGEIYLRLSEIAQGEGSLSVSRQFLEQSLNEKMSPLAKDRLQSVLLALQLPSQTASLTAEDSSTGVSTGVSSIAATTNYALPEAEARAEQRIQQSLDKRDFVTFVEDGISYLSSYPVGRKSKFLQERILEVYLQTVDQLNSSTNFNDSSKYQELIIRMLSIMRRADGLRALEWAKTLHRRGEFNASLELSERAWSDLNKAPQAAQALWIAGRSAQFLGNYPVAQKYFNKYLETCSGGEDAIEMQMRLALVYFRQHQYSSSVALLERLLAAPGGGDKYELSARYWLVRSLQYEKNPKASSEADFLIQKYPLSYYGLRLLIEKNQGELKKEFLAKGHVPLQGTLLLPTSQKEIWDRVQFLARSGWVGEAQKEIAVLTWPKEAAQKMLIAEELAKMQIFPTALKLAGEAMDAENSLRDLGLIAFSFPNPYSQKVQALAQKQGLNPWLINGLIRQESAFGSRAVSTSNAMGLMQLIPATAQETAQELKMGKISIPEDVFSPELNMEMGTYYIGKMIRKFGNNIPMGLAAYNAGPVRMQSFVRSRPEVQSLTTNASSEPADEIWFDELPWTETSFYVKAILRNYLIYRTLEQGSFKVPAVIWSDLLASTEGSRGH